MNKGFTVVELAVILVIVCVLSGMGYFFWLISQALLKYIGS